MRRSKKNNYRKIKSFLKKHTIITKLVLLFALCGAAVLVWKIALTIEDEGYKTPDIPDNNVSEEMVENFSYLAVTQVDQVTESTDEVLINLNDYSDEVLINEEGDYHLKGELEGSLRIKAEEQSVHLYLDNVSITAKDGPAIIVDSAGKVVITLLSGTENVISDSGDYRNSVDYEAAISTTCALTINGDGALTVYGLYEDAIRSKDVVKILDGVISIYSKRTAVHGNDGIHVTGGQIFISSEKKGYKTTKSGIDGRGNIMISGGTHNIIAGEYAFVCSKADLYIFDCEIYNKSVISTYNVKGTRMIEEGCLQ